MSGLRQDITTGHLMEIIIRYMHKEILSGIGLGVVATIQHAI